MRDSVVHVSLGLLGTQTKANLLKNKKDFNLVPTFREASLEKATSLGSISTIVNMHHIYIDPDYMEFTQGNIYSG